MHKNLSKADLLIKRFQETKKRTKILVNGLSPEDMNIQSEDFVSPTKWHLAHTCWFFEQIILKKFKRNYSSYDKDFDYLFNSYYNSIGKQHQRNKRGLISRPSVEDIFNYRDDIDNRIIDLIAEKNNLENDFVFSLEVAINHEQQHQELILMDIQHVFFSNPIKPTYLKKEKPIKKNINHPNNIGSYLEINPNDCFFGSEKEGFYFDNEGPQFKKKLKPFLIGTNTICNGEWKEFINNNCYANPSLWLSDGFDFVNKENISKPLYWIDNDYHFTLRGVQKIIDKNPVTNISFHEAYAFAKWKNKRLPSEFEIEYLLKKSDINGNFQEFGFLEPIEASDNHDLKNLYGNVHCSSSLIQGSMYRLLPGKDECYDGKERC